MIGHRNRQIILMSKAKFRVRLIYGIILIFVHILSINGRCEWNETICHIICLLFWNKFYSSLMMRLFHEIFCILNWVLLTYKLNFTLYTLCSIEFFGNQTVFLNRNNFIFQNLSFQKILRMTRHYEYPNFNLNIW